MAEVSFSVIKTAIRDWYIKLNGGEEYNVDVMDILTGLVRVQLKNEEATIDNFITIYSKISDLYSELPIVDKYQYLTPYNINDIAMKIYKYYSINSKADTQKTIQIYKTLIRYKIIISD